VLAVSAAESTLKHNKKKQERGEGEILVPSLVLLIEDVASGLQGLRVHKRFDITCFLF